MSIINNLSQSMQGATASFDQAGNTIKQSGIMTPVVQLGGYSGASADETNNLLRAYDIDIYQDIKRYKAERHPLLTALFSRSKPADLSRYVVSETHEDGEFFDNMFETLRARQSVLTNGTTWNGRTGYLDYAGGAAPKNPTASTNSAYVGGQLLFALPTINGTGNLDFLECAADASYAAGAAATTAAGSMIGAASSMTYAKITSTTNYAKGWGGKKVAAIGYVAPAAILGNVATVVDKHVAMFTGAGYKPTGVISGYSTEVWNGLEMAPGSSNQVNMLFDNLAMFSVEDPGTAVITNYQFSAKKIGVHQFWYNETWTKFIVVLDLQSSNIDVDYVDLANHASEGTYLFMKQSSTSAAGNSTITANSESLTITGYTYINPCFQLSAAYGEMVDGVPEGSSKRGGNSFKRTFKSKINYTQIFRSEAWSITGTKMAEKKARFIDDWQDTRDLNLMLYKDKMTQAFLWNHASEQDIYNSVTGKYENMRTTSGVWDRELNDYKIVRMSLTNWTTSMTPAEASSALRRLINEVGTSVTAFSMMKTKPTVTVACSLDMIEALGDLEAAGKTGNTQNLFGMMSMGQLPANPAYLGLPTLAYETPRVKLVFMWDPALDYATKLPLPYYLTGVVSPRKIMMALDVKSVGIRTLRADKIQAGIQNIGDDKYEEDIIGEHGVEVFNSRKNTIFIVD